MNFNEIGSKQCNENNHMDSIFVTFKHTVREFREKFFPRVKSEIQIRDFFPQNLKNSKSAKLNFHEIFPNHTVNCERVCFLCNMSAFVSRFQQSRIRELRKFFGQESYRPPSPKVPVRLCPQMYWAK